jgi:hypothetical protein
MAATVALAGALISGKPYYGTYLGCAWPSLAAKAATVTLAVAGALISGEPYYGTYLG